MNINGRVDILTNQPNQFDLADKIPVNQSSSFQDALNGNWQVSPLSMAFFSQQNMQIIQNGIRANVYKQSNEQYLIGQQDPDTLKIIMRSVYLQHSANLPSEIPQQINALNEIVLDYCVKQVLGEAEGYMKYKVDVSTLVEPIDRPSMSSYRTKTLELKPWF